MGAWLVGPLLAWGLTPLWWMTLSSVLVVALGSVQPRRRSVEVFGWLLLGCVAVYLLHWNQPYGTQHVWLAYALALLTAATMIAERGEWTWVRRAVLVAAWCQLPVMLLQLGHGATLWPRIGEGLTGTLGRRWACAVILAMASLWSSPWVAWLLAIASLLTGSFMGAPALARLWWPWRRVWWVALSVGAVVVGSATQWWPRLVLRLSVWRQAPGLTRGVLTGWGFLPLPGGFVYDGGRDGRMAPSVVSDYHSTVVDWIARTGVVGGVILGAMTWWVTRRSQSVTARWVLGLAALVGMSQSVEAVPVLVVVMLAWWIGVSQQGEEHAQSSV